jgi:hypothetical protein
VGRRLALGAPAVVVLVVVCLLIVYLAVPRPDQFIQRHAEGPGQSAQCR